MQMLFLLHMTQHTTQEREERYILQFEANTQFPIFPFLQTNNYTTCTLHNTFNLLLKKNYIKLNIILNHSLIKPSDTYIYNTKYSILTVKLCSLAYQLS